MSRSRFANSLTLARSTVLGMGGQNSKWGLPFVPALEKGASKGPVEDHVHQPGGCRSPVNLDLLGLEGEDREDVAVLSSARRRRGANVAHRSGVVRELEGALRESRAELVAGAGRQLGDAARNVHHGPVPEAKDR